MNVAKKTEMYKVWVQANYKPGTCLDDLCKATDLSEYHVRKAVDALGITLARKPVDISPITLRAVKLYESGLKLREIADFMGISEQSVKNRIYKYNRVSKNRKRV